jgi:hypothetical protein
MPDSSSNPPSPPAIPTGQELYDALMGHIEPELTTEGQETLAEKYKGETPEEQEERKKRYELAFERYEQAYQDYIQTLQAQVERYRRNSFQHVELEDRVEEEGLLGRLQDAIFRST